MKNKIGTIEKETDLMTWLIAETVAEKVMMERHEAKHGKGNMTEEQDKAITIDIKNWKEYLTDKAENCFQANENFRKKIKGKGNSGRDYLYMFMYHWMGVQDSRVFSPQMVVNKKSMYEYADKDLQRWLTTKKTD